jgi:hypothetical protein
VCAARLRHTHVNITHDQLVAVATPTTV